MDFCLKGSKEGRNTFGHWTGKWSEGALWEGSRGKTLEGIRENSGLEGERLGEQGINRESEFMEGLREKGHTNATPVNSNKIP